MSNIASLREQYGEYVVALSAALETGDEAGFGAALDEIVHLREKSLFSELRQLSVNLRGALERFTLDSRLVDLAEKEVPDAKHRLDHVLKLTDEAAHKTMDLVEQSEPIAARTSKAANDLNVLWKRFRARDIAVQDFRGMVDHMDKFLDLAQSDTDTIRRNLSEVLLTQGYQDLTGQIIRGVMNLVGELELTLGELVRLSSTDPAKKSTVTGDTVRGFGPVVPGVNHGVTVNGQQDVDSLLSGLGI
jgi:chemotaxis protein CheZ